MSQDEVCTLPDGTVLRDLQGQAELDDALKLQEETWGEGFKERVPPAILLVAQKIRGIAAGAFSVSGALVGFVFGLTGVRGGRLVHWSDMLAVRPERQGRGLGASEPLPHADVVAVRVPNDCGAPRERDLEQARAWRASVRRAFAHDLGLGWQVSAFVPSRDGDASYVLTKPSGGALAEPGR
jgi:predicted GNAT superfamily acetyltransferase